METPPFSSWDSQQPKRCWVLIRFNGAPNSLVVTMRMMYLVYNQPQCLVSTYHLVPNMSHAPSSSKSNLFKCVKWTYSSKPNAITQKPTHIQIQYIIENHHVIGQRNTLKGGPILSSISPLMKSNCALTWLGYVCIPETLWWPMCRHCSPCVLGMFSRNSRQFRLYIHLWCGVNNAYAAFQYAF